MTSAQRVPLMRTSVTTFDSRARQRFHALAYHARYHARTDAEAVEVDRVVAAVRAGALCARDGHAALSALRRDQVA
jgi:hypothetical protein